MMHAMAVRILLLVTLLSVPACAPEPVVAASADGELVLELGGEHRSLAASLRGLGVSLLPPRSLDDEFALDAQAPAQAEDSPPPSPPAAADPPPPASEPAPAPPPADASPQWFEVKLEPRQTLIDLARKHLGSANRFEEILRLNGWNEADARRLKAGQKVKIPRGRGP